ncbi:MAG: TlpA family protein disulfide reductase [Clostridiales bacterium]|nr:TlpA family protein disulfide reductase [Clostridiales bacterium]
MKKILIAFSLCCFMFLCMLICAACAYESKEPTEVAPPTEGGDELTDLLYDLPVRDGQYILEDEQHGIAFGIPVGNLEDHTIYYGQFGLADGPQDTLPLNGVEIYYFPPNLLQELSERLIDDPSDETMDEVAQAVIDGSRLLYSILYYSAGMWDSWLLTGKTIADITGNDINYELGRQDGRVYVYTEPLPNEQGLEGTELAVYREAVAAVPAMRKNAAMLELVAPAATDANAFPEFSAKDIYGADIGSNIFAECDITMVNIWGTFCDPCIMELPDLAEMADNMPPGTQLIGLVGDAVNKDTVELAQLIAKETGAAFPHIVPDKVLNDYLRYNIAAYPTTLFINRDGNIVGEPLVGARSRDQYEAFLNERLNLIR